jgi:hypothetical protein
MVLRNGSTKIPARWISATDLEAYGLALGVKPRLLAGWRERELIPHPTLFGHEGKRPVWAYPPATDRRLECVVRWRRTTRDLEAIKLALWAEGFAVPIETVRAVTLHVLDGLEQAMLRDLARFAPAGAKPEALLQDPAALRPALEAYAAELARMRTRFPTKRRVEMKLFERERGMRYWLFLLYGLETDRDDAVQLERIFGLSRGRSGTARGELSWPAHESFPKTPIVPSDLRYAVSTAEDNAFAFVTAAVQALMFFPTLMPMLLPADSHVRTAFIDLADVFREAPAHVIGVFAAVQFANLRRHSLPADTLASYTRTINPMNLIKELLPVLDPSQSDQLADLVEQIRQRPHQ